MHQQKINQTGNS